MKIGLAIKDPMLSYNMRRKRMTKDEVIAIEKSMGKNIERIIASTERQLNNAQKVREIFDFASEVDVYKIFDLHEIPPDFDAIIALGGDNHFQKVAQLYKNAIIIGANSDSITSHGGILQFSVNELITNADRIKQGDIPFEEWTMIATYKNEYRLPDAICNVDFPASHYMARFMIKGIEDNKEWSEEQKCSRAVIATGAGSADGSHYHSIVALLKTKYPEQFQGEIEFQRDEPLIKAVSETPFRSGQPLYNHLNPLALSGQAVEYKVWHMNDSTLAIDTVHFYPLQEGDKLTFKVSEKKLKVAIK
ncbi:MAG: hypothetical protein ACMXYG_07615 [Candidatus Woesearchaeota archaeon]